MKVTIESNLTNPTFKLTDLFGFMINVLVQCDSRESLKNELEWLFSNDNTNEYFQYGFGGGHLWIIEKCTNKRIIFVEL